MFSKHLLDSLSLLPHVSKINREFCHIADIGTGGGLPGIPLAICFPQIKFTLVDSAGKKIRFLHQVVQSLGLNNVNLENGRVESYQPAVKYHIVLSRAFASLADMTRLCSHLLDQDGRFWAMKGVFPQEEIQALEKNLLVEHNHDLDVPDELGARCLVVIKSVS